MMHPPVLFYRGFEIGRFNTIYKDGKPIFTASHQYNWDLEQAKRRIDQSLAATLAAMPDKQAALKKLTTSCELENGQAEADQFTNWMETEADKQNEPEL